MSDHSSLFDSVSGTAINLGRGAPVPLHGSHQRISSLARSDVRDLQPGLIKDSTLMRPAVAESSNRPLATEAHPNPSVIPELAEENVRGEKHFENLSSCKTIVPQVRQWEPSVATESKSSVVKQSSRTVNSYQEIPTTTFSCAAQVLLATMSSY